MQRQFGVGSPLDLVVIVVQFVPWYFVEGAWRGKNRNPLYPRNIVVVGIEVESDPSLGLVHFDPFWFVDRFLQWFSVVVS